MKKHTKDSIIVENPSTADNARTFLDGSTRSYATLQTAAVGFGTYKPGWKWSLHTGPQVGKDSENHIGYVISGQMVVEDAFGNKAEIAPGFAFELAPGCDAWVIGDVPCIALDFIPI